ncbi:TrmH family RNA methyltransferase [Haloferula chungangensis]|uniref:TrmH family RNA methyltransferase n=1 Tax=Haloferula chungangensis TaxID=1048331 RepID=A0ABW2L5Q9_9BACT
MDDEPDWVRELQKQITDREDPWVILEGRQAVEAAVAGWWDLAGILAGENCDWEPPVWSGLELHRRPIAELDRLVGPENHEGVLGLTKLPDETADVAGLMKEMDEDALVVVCPRLHSEEQVGSILKNAAALGAQAVIFGREGVSPFERGAVRASAGAVFRLPVRVADGGQILRCLKTAGFTMIGGAAGEGSVSLESLEIEPGRLAIVLGAEVEGLGRFWNLACDSLAHVPVETGSAVLDPAATSAVFMWELARRRKEQAESDG